MITLNIVLGVVSWKAYRQGLENPEFFIKETGSLRAHNHGGAFYYRPTSSELNYLLSLN